MKRQASRLHLAFAGMGATASSIPAILPAAQSGLGQAVLAGPPILFLGLLLGVVAAPLVGSRYSPTKIVAMGAGIQGFALVGAASSSTPEWFVVAAGLAGFGFGFTESAGGVAAKVLTETTAAATLTGLITTTAAVAAGTPVIIWLVAYVPLDPMSILLLPAAVNVLAALLVAPASASPPRVAATSHRRSIPAQVVVFAVAVAVYVGVESVLSGWSSAIPFRLLDVDPSLAALGTSAFWILMTIGRATATVVLRRGATPRMVLATGSGCAALALATSALLASADQPTALISLAVALVLLAPTYGLLLGTALDRVPSDTVPRVSSIIIASGAAGGAVLPLALVWAGIGPGDPLTFLTCATGASLLVSCVFVMSQPHRARKRSAPNG